MIEAVLLAGSSTKRRVSGKDKFFLKFQGKYLGQYIIDALSAVERCQKIYIVGPGEQIEQALQARHIPIEVIPAPCDNSFLNNALLGTDAVLVNHIRNQDASEDSSDEAAAPSSGIMGSMGRIPEELIEQPLLFTFSDTPFLSAAIIDRFLDKCRESEGDFFYPLVPVPVMSSFIYGSKAMLPFREGFYYAGNLGLIKPWKVPENRLEFFQQAYEARDVSRRRNILRITKKLLELINARDAVALVKGVLALKMQRWTQKLSAGRDKNKRVKIARYLSTGLAIDHVAARCSKFLGMKVVFIELPFPEACLDVDSEWDLEHLDANHSRLLLSQKSARQ